MRSARGLLLLAIAGILGGVAATYYQQRKSQARRAPTPPVQLPAGVGAAAQDWQWARNIGSRPGVQVRARSFRQRQDQDRIELEDVELRLYQEDGRSYDEVRCAHAVFDPRQAVLFSDGEVDIVMGLRSQGPQGRLVHIRAAGVTFHSDTGRVTTDRPAEFALDQGGGHAQSATYDPTLRELHLRGQVELEWRGRGPRSRPMKLEAGELLYKEAEALILLFPPARLQRDHAVLEAQRAAVKLREGAIREVEAERAAGSDQQPDRRIEYSADTLHMLLAANGELEALTAEGNVRLAAYTPEASETATASRLDLWFTPGRESSILTRALASGGARLESVPRPRSGVPTPPTRVLESEVIQVYMRPDGRQVDRVQTEAPGKLEMHPNQPDQQRRMIQAERLWIQYAESGRPRSLRAVGVATRSEPEGSRPEIARRAPLETWSRDLLAEFDPDTGRLARVEQWNDFRYREGERQARAQRAVLDQTAHRITLEGQARAWDPTGAISADRLELDQTSGDLAATGRVAATHLPDRKGSSSALLSNEESLQAEADRMVTFEGRRKALYEGRVLMWQRANRLQAHRVELDRGARRLAAVGDVITQFADRAVTQRDADRPKTAQRADADRAPSFVVVRAASLVYTEADRLAHYSGGVQLRRANLEVRAAELLAYLSPPDSDSSLQRALALGQVEIAETVGGRARRASAERALYDVKEEKVVLEGGRPVLTDSARGQTRGARLTWRMRDDSFQVEGAEHAPVLSRLRR